MTSGSAATIARLSTQSTPNSSGGRVFSRYQVPALSQMRNDTAKRLRVQTITHGKTALQHTQVRLTTLEVRATSENELNQSAKAKALKGR